MRISGFTYIRNGYKYQYPFIESIQSLLPLVDELIVVVGDSVDGTRAAVESLAESKIKIVDSVWDISSRKGGEIFAEQANLGIRNCSGDWLIHLQADEVLMEDCKTKILRSIQLANSYNSIDGILFPFLHFWGDYNYIHNTRRTHRFEIRAFKNNRGVFSYKDSQGFRKFSFKLKGEKLNVIKTNSKVFHYSYFRHPKLMKRKSNYFKRFWHSDDWIQKKTNGAPFDFNYVDKLDLYTGSHPNLCEMSFQKKIGNSVMTLLYKI